MVANLDDEQAALRRLLPRGLVWTQVDDGILDRLLRGLAGEFCRVFDRASDLVRESDPRTTLELLADWERVLGLPGLCTDPPATVAGRRAAVVAQLTEEGGQSIAYFTAVAFALGYDIDIVEHRPFRAGPSVGDPWQDGSQSRAGDALTNGDWVYAWNVQAPGETVRPFKAGSLAGEALRVWSNTVLECVLGRLAPAHTLVRFLYGADAVPPRQPVALTREPDASGICLMDPDWNNWIRNHNAATPVLESDTPPAGSHGPVYTIGSSAGAVGPGSYTNRCDDFGDATSRSRLEVYVKEPLGTPSEFFWLRLLKGVSRVIVSSNEFRWVGGVLTVVGGTGVGSVMAVGGGWYLARSERTVAGEAGEQRWGSVELPEASPWPDEFLLVASARVISTTAGTPFP